MEQYIVLLFCGIFQCIIIMRMKGNYIFNFLLIIIFMILSGLYFYVSDLTDGTIYINPFK